MAGKSVEKSVMPGKNGGTLNRGGNTTPGTGRPKSAIREKCAGSFEQRIKVAEEILDDPSSTNADKIRALDLLGKYAGLQQTDITTNDQPIQPAVHTNLEQFTPEQLKALEAILGGSIASPHSEGAEDSKTL